ncbi:MAG TPA: hypothetical protein DEH78_27510 [Solibacterales bacterium]|nr:hypothetical protein [Bryobacterales bacterium]
MTDLRLPGLLVRFRAAAPFRFGPDSGAPDRVDRLCHSDTLYSAVCAAMRELGHFEAFLEATAVGAESQLSFSSCFPWQDDLLFVTPPAGLWPPPASGKVRWKGARFVPLSLIPVLLEEKVVDEERWVVDGSSGCLLPLNRRSPYGPYRIAMRTSAAVDRLSPGACEVHTTACLEFSDNAGLWCAVAFASEAARNRWIGPLRAAFRLLADTGIGGERTRGWGRSLEPRFHEGSLPDLLLAPPRKKQSPPPKPVEPLPVAAEPAEVEPVTPLEDSLPEALDEIPEPPPPMSAVAQWEPPLVALLEAPAPPAALLPEAAETMDAAAVEAPIGEASETEPAAGTAPPAEPETGAEPEIEAEPEAKAEPETEAQPEAEAPPETFAAVESPGTVAAEPPAPLPALSAPEEGAARGTGWWLLSLFNPAASDAIDWQKGTYSLVTRSGRIESRHRSGEVKKTVHMVAEGSVLVAAAPPKGRAADVAPEGFPHPVYRAGFAFAIPIPWRVNS